MGTNEKAQPLQTVSAEPIPIQNEKLKALRDDRIRMEKYGEIYYARDIETNGFLIYRDPPDRMQNGAIQTNIPHVCIDHSPTGFEFGYGGSGPADLALNIIEVYLQLTGYEGARVDVYEGDCFALAQVLHQDFKNEMIANIPDAGMTLLWELVDRWVKFQMKTDRIIERMQRWGDFGYEF